MKNFLKIVAVAAIAVGLAACADDNTTDSSNGMSKYQQCAAVKNKMRMLDRSQPGAKAQYRKLESQLTKLNCGAK